jgi:hypothetical protein
MPTKLTQREQEKFDTINRTFSGHLTNEQAARMLGISTRQIMCLKKRVQKEGASAVVHQLKGRQSNHHIDVSMKERALSVIEKQYGDFKPTFATEKLSENHNITISYGTTRLWMIERKLWKPRKRKQREYRSWRPRKEYFGELIQFDGS